MKKTLLILLLTASTGLIGCSHKSELTNTRALTKPLPRVNLEAEVTAELNAPLPPGETAPTPQAQTAKAPKKPITAEESQSILQKDELAQNELNQALQTFQKTRGDAPNDIRELVVAKLIRHVPTPPQGGAYVIDPLAKAVVWSRQ